jgi:uncharacterized protein with NRDE domain
MCLVLVGWRIHPRYRLIVAANRDEYHVRRSAALQSWPETTGLIAGRDLDSGDATPGVWIGTRHNGGRHRFAAVTNVYGPPGPQSAARSRGGIALEFLRDDRTTPAEFAERLCTTKPDDYLGYHLLISDLQDLWWGSNRAAAPARLEPGFHAIANDPEMHTLTNPVGAASDDGTLALKAHRGLEAFATVVDTAADDVDGYFAMLSDRTPLPMETGRAPSGLPPTMHRMFSARFVSNTFYGTRSSTVILVEEDGAYVVAERSYGPRGRHLGDVAFDGGMATSGGER